MTDAELVAALAESVQAVIATEREAHARAVGVIEDRVVALEEQIKAIPAPAVLPPSEPGPRGESGVGIRSAIVRGGDLVLVMTDGTEHNAGRVEGKQGEPGRDGVAVKGDPGRDGRDGVASVDEIRAIATKAVDDRLEAEVQKRVVEAVSGLPTLQYRGVFKLGETYRAGDCATWGGSLWHANEATTEKPGEGSKAWTLAVKRGRDGKDAQK